MLVELSLVEQRPSVSLLARIPGLPEGTDGSGSDQ